MSFNKKPSINTEVKSFINEPINGTNTNTNTNTNTSINTKPWEDHNKESKTRTVFNVRFNKYYESAYKHFSEKLGYDSYQNFVRGIIEDQIDIMIENYDIELPLS